MQSQHSLGSNPLEQAGYFKVSGAHLYTVLHGSVDPVARVLLVGPFASERHHSYIPWVRWARYLAARRIECLRYDYRGIGESTGVFENMSFDTWKKDVDLLAGWLESQSPHVPLMLHGLELGALLAAKAFDAGVGDGLLLWSPPASANQALRATLSRRISIEQAFKYGDERKPSSYYIGQLESGGFLEVEGYQWSGRLWQESFGFELPAGMAGEGAVASMSERPLRIVKLDQGMAPLTKGSSVGYDAVNRDFTGLFADNFGWIAQSLGILQEGNSERCN